jgi:hypothetical protein
MRGSLQGSCPAAIEDIAVSILEAERNFYLDKGAGERQSIMIGIFIQKELMFILLPESLAILR